MSTYPTNTLGHPPQPATTLFHSKSLEQQFRTWAISHYCNAVYIKQQHVKKWLVSMYVWKQWRVKMWNYATWKKDFDVLLTVHLSIFILVINQLDAQNFCFTISLLHACTCLEHHVLIMRRYNTIIQFWPLHDEHMVFETCRGMKQTYCTTKILCIKLVNY